MRSFGRGAPELISARDALIEAAAQAEAEVVVKRTAAAAIHLADRRHGDVSDPEGRDPQAVVPACGPGRSWRASSALSTS
jgi:hypothetical protein